MLPVQGEEGLLSMTTKGRRSTYASKGLPVNVKLFSLWGTKQHKSLEDLYGTKMNACDSFY
jgi:hypothetical protein